MQHDPVCQDQADATDEGDDALEDSELEVPRGYKNILATAELRSTLKVLQGLRKGMVSDETTFPEIIGTVETLLSLHEGARMTSRAAKPGLKKCYICRFIVSDPHPEYASLCRPCGAFNLAEGGLSLSANLSLVGRTAVVTGGRVNLGFHTAIRLLRCGACVIVSSRYPRDADLRYRALPDSKGWIGRLRLVGADFRRAKDVFRFVATIKDILREWDYGAASKSGGVLHILINNAAQTLADPIATEKKAIQNEMKLQKLLGGASSVVENGYEATIRGGSRMLGGLVEASELTEPEISQPYSSYTSQKTEPRPSEVVALYQNNMPIVNSRPQVSKDTSFQDTMPTSGAIPQNAEAMTRMPGNDAALISKPSRSSWVQSLTEIPYEDVISAHSVNTFVPMILIRELLPLMGQIESTSSDPPSKPLAHIINVSSREGIFESTPDSSEKGGHHVHTNMSKAGLNMITEIEAATAWKSRRIAMNTVDPGYMSAAPEMRARGECPIGFDDGAGRVLWPVAVAERGDAPVWGRFLKHFGRVDVDVGLGRG
ncbi:hypothetical protein MMC28_009070 [Mycoblastus sanguinarius]|nr:hypothetical protein [Mycoblastus sanguinarius]